MQTSTPFQYSKAGVLVKKFLHTKAGAFLAYHAGISGFNRLDVFVNGKRLGSSYNSRVDKGAALAASLIAGSSLGSITSPLPPLYVALSTSSLTPAKGDTTLTGETAVSGLTRALGAAGTYTAPAALDGAASYVITKQFTAGGSATIASAALFDAASTGNMFVEANLSSSAVLISGDLITISWTVNL